MDSKSRKFLYEYLNNVAPTGYEASGQKIWLDYIRPFIDDHFADSYGTAVGVINPKSDYRVVIEAHADEISWFINYINKDGYIYVIRNGGSDYQIAPSMRAKIHTDQGVYPAIFGWPAILVRDPKADLKMDVDTIVLDCGCASDGEVKSLGIHVGSVVTFDEDLMELNRKFLVGRALDNRIGGFMIAEVTRRIKESKLRLSYGLYITNSVQEEVGLRGAEMIARRINPDLAIITDVTHDTQSPHYNKIKQGDLKCGSGPVLTYAPAVHNNVLKMIKQVADKNKIPYQLAASSRATGTDTDAFAYSNAGVPSALISLPLKYMHTTVETVQLNDIENIIRLILAFLKQLHKSHDFGYLKK